MFFIKILGEDLGQVLISSGQCIFTLTPMD